MSSVFKAVAVAVGVAVDLAYCLSLIANCCPSSFVTYVAARPSEVGVGNRGTKHKKLTTKDTKAHRGNRESDH